MTDNKDRPILFSAPMVQALLAGAKTQTRRIIKPQPIDIKIGQSIVPSACGKCLYGQPGDRLWVREAFAFYGMEASTLPPVFYRADDDTKPGWATPPDIRWRPSIHMPRWASRITLEITEVRVQRLQEISEEDAKAEGVGQAFLTKGLYWQGGTALIDQRNPTFNPSVAIAGSRAAFAMLWESIHGPGAWKANPWVWALSFRVLDAAERL
jgi:hypothetical protein